MTPLPLDDKTTLSIFDRMLIMRYVEEAVLRLYQERRFASHYHLYIGRKPPAPRCSKRSARRI